MEHLHRARLDGAPRLSAEGVKEIQFHKISGYGDNRPLKKYVHDLSHAYHNRVSIMVRAAQYQP